MDNDGTVPMPLPRVAPEHGGHIWRPHGREATCQWLWGIGAPSAAAASTGTTYPDDVVILAAHDAGNVEVVRQEHMVRSGGDRPMYFAVLKRDWEGHGGIKEILDGKWNGRGMEPPG